MKFNEIKFTQAEVEILKLMQQELSVDEIIKAKAISKVTMTNHLNNIYHKTNDVVPYGSAFRKFITLRNYITDPDFEGFTGEKPRKTKEYKKKDKDSMINQPLTEMEQTVLDLLLQGLNYKQIAEKIPISYTTVKTHINNIFQKKDCHSLQELLVAEFDKNKPVFADTKEEENPIKEVSEAVQTDLEEVREEENRIFTLYEPIEKLRLQYNNQIEEWSKQIMQTKIKLEALKELERIEK